MTSAPRGAAIHPLPPNDHTELAGFPRKPGGGAWYRAHVDRAGPDRGCWWFASLRPGQTPESAGRFDLRQPRGTCYAGSTAEVAIRERVGTVLQRVAGVLAVNEDVLKTPDGPVMVSAITLPNAELADITSGNAKLWNVNRSLSSGGGIYHVTQAWAGAFDHAGFDGVWFAPRFTSGAVQAVAVFGDAGAPASPAPVTETVSARAVLTELGVRIVSRPYRRPSVLSPDAAPPVL